ASFSRTPPSWPRASLRSRAAGRSYSFCLYDQSVTGVTESLAGIAVEARPRIIWSKRHGERIGIMPITPFLRDQEFDQETTRIMGSALEMARAAAKRDWGCHVYASHILAKRIIELAKGGERNPHVLCEQALSYFSARLAI